MPESKKHRTEDKYLECLHLRISLLENLFNNASHQAPHDPQGGTETLGIGERVTGIEKRNYINHNFRSNLRDSSGHFCCPAEGCGRSYKTAADLHVHIRRQPGNGHDILKRIIDRTYCIRCELQCYKPRELKHHEKSSHGDIYDSRIELFLGCLTQDAPQEAPVAEVDDGPADDLSILSDQAPQRRMSDAEPSTDPQAFTNNQGSRASDSAPFVERGAITTSTPSHESSFAPALTPRANKDYQHYASPNNATTQDPIFPFELAPVTQLNAGFVIDEIEDTLNNGQVSNASLQNLDFPFDLAPYPGHDIGIDDNGIDDTQTNNSFAKHPDLAPPMVPFQQQHISFAESDTVLEDLGDGQTSNAYRNLSFPFDMTPSQQQNISMIGGQSNGVLTETHTLPTDTSDSRQLEGSHTAGVWTFNQMNGAVS